MLDRILNINPQEKYKNGLKIPSSNYYSIHRQDQHRHHSKDTALFSPLAKLLSKINWRILSIEYPSNDEILFNFLVDEYEFNILINLKGLCKDSFQEILLTKSKKQNNRLVDYQLKLKTEKYKISLLNEPDIIKTEYISEMFDRIADLNISSDYKTLDQSLLNSFVNGIELELNDELNYILKVIYTFISTKNKSRIKNNFILKTDKNIPIIMQKMSIIYAE